MAGDGETSPRVHGKGRGVSCFSKLVAWWSSLAQRTKRMTLVVGTLLGAFAVRNRETSTKFLYSLTLPVCELHQEPAIVGPPTEQYVRTSWEPASSIDFVSVTAFPDNLRSSVASVCHFYDTTSGLGTWHLVVPDRMVAYFSSHLDLLKCADTGAAGGARKPIKFRVWPESELIPVFTEDAPYGGTVRQMMLKIAASKVVTAPFYLVLDSDVYARRPFNLSSLLAPGVPRDAGPKGRPAPRTRAVTNLDYPRFAQPLQWHAQASRALQTPLFQDTWEHCKRVVNRVPPRHSGPASRPYALITDPASGKRVFDVCHSWRPLVTHVTPMVLSAEIMRSVLIPRLEAVAKASGVPASGCDDGSSSSSSSSEPTWYDALLHFHTTAAARCRQGVSGGRFYSWTEFSLYFLAAADAGALDDFHSFDGSAPDEAASGGVTSFKYSMMLPEEYDAADWDALFTDASESSPLFIVHSWFNKPLGTTNGHLARHIPSLRDPGAWYMPQAPSPEPLYEDRERHRARGKGACRVRGAPWPAKA